MCIRDRNKDKKPSVRKKLQQAISKSLKKEAVAVPVRLEIDHIGEAILLCARTRPKFVGGERAHYNPDLM